jgi:hypothetical protein
VHLGEGKYQETEEQIQKLLSETGVSTESFVKLKDENNFAKTSETYLGYSRLKNFSSNEDISEDVTKKYSTGSLILNSFAFDGNWVVGGEYSMPEVGSKLDLNFTASKVYLVMRNSNQNGKVRVFVDGKPIASNISGKDVTNSEVVVSEDRLYELVSMQKGENHVLTLEFLDGSIEVYAFTFG